MKHCVDEKPWSVDGVVCDRQWAGDRREAVLCAAVVLALLLLVDGCSGQLTPLRAVLWAGLAALLLAVLLPPRVAAGPGWLASRGLLGERRVRTDCLVSVRLLDGVSRRLVLRDLYGGRVELDPGVLVANPMIRHLLDQGAVTSGERGLLGSGATVVRLLSRRLDSETARLLFTTSGLK
ncbi:hypothetical protein [Streptomyces sp. NPDC042319]|uniref:hypothetical protein n=1 Tax=Streptomyces sp. NPDC042319 TaxID=3154332 RepID=UPI003409BF52